MIRFLFSLFFFSLIFFFSLEAKIIEINKIEEALPYVDSETLVVLDIDDTLIVPKQMLGGDCWFRTRIKTLHQRGFSFEEALAKTLPDYFTLQHNLDVLPVEETTAQVVHQLQKRGSKVIGLTTRSPEMAHRTIEQLRSIDIDLSLVPLVDTKHDLNTYFPHAYIKGILFTQVSHKGEVLYKLCKHMGYAPKKVIFINDKLKYVKQLEETFNPLDIPYIGMRYAACDEHIHLYDPQIAEIQYNYFGSILSNEDAAHLLKEMEELQK